MKKVQNQRKQYFLLFGFLFAAFGIVAQEPEKVIDKINAKINSVKDYTVNAHIDADIPMIKIMPSNAKIYFKQKDKVKIESKGITILPKQGFTELNAFLSDKSKYSAVFGDSLKINGTDTRLINIIPNAASGEIVLAKIWVDQKNSVIMRSQVTTQTNGTVKTDFKYGSQLNYGLPSELKFEIDVKKFKMPKSVAADINRTSADKKKTKEKQRTKGTITITLSDYKVNGGLSDAIFKDKKK
jgi:outer membrane lipoprotein-sorting protein